MNSISFIEDSDRDVFDKVMKLSEKYRIVLFLFYDEQYKIKYISKILKVSEANVKVRLNRGRKLLKEMLEV